MDYKTDNILRLLEKYFEGNTSLTEEEQLKDFYRRHHELTPELEQYRAVFAYFDTAAAPQLSDDFSRRLEDRLQTSTAHGSGTARIIPLTLRRAAAAVLLLLASWFGYQYLLTPEPEPQMAQAEAVSDPEEAYALLEDALLLASNKLNRGADHATREMQHAHKATAIFRKGNPN